MKIKLKWILLSIIAVCSFALNSCGKNDDEPKGEDLGDGLKTGFYVTKDLSNNGYETVFGEKYYVGERRYAFKILDGNTLMNYGDISLNEQPYFVTQGTIELMGKKWYTTLSYVCTYIKNGNKIIVPNWEDGTILTILPDGSLLKDGSSTDFAYHHVAK